jgi:hypothetical protein
MDKKRREGKKLGVRVNQGVAGICFSAFLPRSGDTGNGTAPFFPKKSHNRGIDRHFILQ